MDFLDSLPTLNLKKKMSSQEKIDQTNKVYRIFKVKKLHSGVGAKNIAFFSLQHGSGNSEIAFNTALKLAEHNRVLYVSTEFYSSIFYEYQLAIHNKELQAISDLENGMDKIITIADLKDRHKDDPFTPSIKQFSPNLSYLRVTPKFQTQAVKMSLTDLKAVLKKFKVAIQTRFDYIIFDLENDLHTITSQLLLNYVSDIVLTFNQNIVQIDTLGNFIDFAENNLADKNTYCVLNQYNNNAIAEIRPSYIKQMIDHKINAVITQDTALFWNAAFNALPPIYYDQTGKISAEIDKICQLIL